MIGRVVYCRETTGPSILKVSAALLDCSLWRVTEEIVERMTCHKGHSPDSYSQAHGLLCTPLSQQAFPGCVKFLCTSVLWCYGGAARCWLPSPIEWPWGEWDWAYSAALAPGSLGPNTSSALSCKYHQQLVAHKLVVLNKLLAYMWRGSGLHLPPCQPSGRTNSNWFRRLS